MKKQDILAQQPCLPFERTSKTGLVAWFSAMLAVKRERRQLSQLTDAQLRDIGLTREQAEKEAKQSLWNIPQKRL